MSETGSQKEATDKLPASQKRKRGDSITSISAGESSDEEPDANFGTRTPVHPSQLAHLLPPTFPAAGCIEARQYEALKKATACGDLGTPSRYIKS